jgi:hypothetical protein
VGVELRNQLVDPSRIGYVAVVQKQVLAWQVVVMVQVVDPAPVKARGAADQTVDFIALFQQLLGHIRAVLTGYTGN